MLRRVLKWAFWIFLVFLVYAIFNSPAQAAAIVVNAFEGIGAAGGAVFAFFDEVLRQSSGAPAGT
ncbi:hypothetical protein [Aquipuribacter nitratireducens]|uniref:Uncharacterized protein n=1 Tax=Aquipuribacter nitratireducens TaxID=650104 RepID=A0ABW0GR27_9MICO